MLASGLGMRWGIDRTAYPRGTRLTMCNAVVANLTAADGVGYEIDEAEVIDWGRCPECVAPPSAAPGG